MANDNQQKSGNQLGNPQNKSRQGISECLYTQNLNIYPHIIISMQNGPKWVSCSCFAIKPPLSRHFSGYCLFMVVGYIFWHKLLHLSFMGYLDLLKRAIVKTQEIPGGLYTTNGKNSKHWLSKSRGIVSHEMLTFCVFWSIAWTSSPLKHELHESSCEHEDVWLQVAAWSSPMGMTMFMTYDYHYW
jgi:hypothetical protein